MAQSSGPISQGSLSDRQFTDELWRNIFGDESGVIGDYNGTAYDLVLPSDSNFARVGSNTIKSTARVAGFGHAIPVGDPESIEVPPAALERTDVLALRYDPAFSGQPGPVRLVRIAGTSSAIPAYDDAPPGPEDMPLWAVTRKPGQSLAQATKVRLFPRITPSLTVEPGALLPPNSPIGTPLRRGTEEYIRELDDNGVPVWVRQKRAGGFLASATPSGFLGTNDARFSLGSTGAVTLTSSRRIKITLQMNLYAAKLQTCGVYVAAFAGAARTLITSRNVRVGGSSATDIPSADLSGSIVLPAGTYTFRIEGSSNAPTGSTPEAAGVAYVDPTGTPNLLIEDIGPG